MSYMMKQWQLIPSIPLFSIGGYNLINACSYNSIVGPMNWQGGEDAMNAGFGMLLILLGYWLLRRSGVKASIKGIILVIIAMAYLAGGSLFIMESKDIHDAASRSYSAEFGERMDVLSPPLWTYALFFGTSFAMMGYGLHRMNFFKMPIFR